MAEQHSTPSVIAEIEQVIKLVTTLGILVPRVNEIKNLLAQYLGLCETVLSISKQAVLSFPQPSRLSLELYRDPEIDDSRLTLYIRQPDYSPDIMEQNDNFRNRLFNEK